MVKGEKNKLFGLLGRNISYSFSREYFTEKFKELKLENHKYINFDLQQIEDLSEILKENKNVLCGLNVTIPYKEEVFPFLDTIDKKAKKIGAVNSIKISKKGKLKGYNTDYYGFKNSLKPLLKKHHTKALILGTGGASKAVAHALKKLDIKYKFVTRTKRNEEMFTYSELTSKEITEYTIIINCTPLGTHPNIENRPDIPYQYINEKHLLYDLIYNPAKTTFLSLGKKQGATTKNGLEMLELQAEKSWKIWNK
ncbi:shikimate dehydrogenase [Tenacibaculum adriaticum]|uniref:Shikimate dehydrogenase n=1 Tax=Tenacibaculum adriaticum TaxID=413713 RepID=A0A5S5DNM8_9FLAO|nr:shikimate dehydrogenase [Tenacibaculum adriaticum]TYP97553.1 shikimate dehydrogenase [Tenacibaculum adriaticum]